MTLRVEIRPSRLWLGAGMGLHGLAVAGVWSTAFPWPVRAGLTLGLLVAGGHWWWRERGSRRVRVIACDRHGWTLTRGADTLPVAPLPVSRAGPWGQWLVFRCHDDGRTHRVALLPDSADPEALRRLRVALRYQSSTDPRAPG